MDQATQSLLSWLSARLSEPSTWVSLGTMITAIGFNIAPEYWTQIAAVGMGLGGLAGLILKEKKTTTAQIKSVAEKAVEEKVSPEALK